MSEHDAIIENLNAKKVELEERLERVEASLRKTHAKDWGEQALERENEEVIEALEVNIRTELAQIFGALKRVEKGEFGICVVCDEPIRKERLEVLPYIDRCFNCANEPE